MPAAATPTGRGLKWALRTAQMLAAYNVDWFEEALRPDALEDFVVLRRQSPGADRRRRGRSRAGSPSRPFLRAGAFDIVQPDMTKVGGISEGRRIGWMAKELGCRLIPHGWNTAVGLAADLQLASALPDTDLIEYKTGSAYIDELVTVPWKLDSDGMLAIPEAPGLGIQLDPEALARYARPQLPNDATAGI